MTKTLNQGKVAIIQCVLLLVRLIMWIVSVYDNDSVLECRLTTRQKKNEDIAYPVSQQNVYTFSH